MDFNAQLAAAHRKRAQYRRQRADALRSHRDQAAFDDGIKAPEFDARNMVEQTWFKAGQRGVEQTVLVHEYPYASDAPGDFDTIVFERKPHDQPDAAYRQMGPSIDVENAASQFPVSVPMAAEYMRDEGTFDFRFNVVTSSGQQAYSDPVTAILDWTAPGTINVQPEAVVYPFDLATTLIDDKFIADHPAGIDVQVPPYAHRDPRDRIIWAWAAALLPDGSLPPGALHVAPLLDDYVLNIPIDVINNTQEVEGRCFLFYALQDMAENRSDIAKVEAVRVAKGPVPQPGTPSVPLADPVLEYADIQEGIDVVVPSIGEYRWDDKIAVFWGGTELDEVVAGSGIGFPRYIRVPDQVLASEYPQATEGEITIDVRYEVRRGIVAWPSPIIQVTMDFSTAGPENPDWPDPVNGGLPRLVVTPYQGDDDSIIGEDNRGQDAEMRFELYPEAQEGDVIQAYWREVRVGDPHTVTADEAATTHARAQIAVVIPWPAIEAAGDDLALPASYSIRPASNINEVWSPTTRVRVLVVPIELLAPSFPQTEGDPINPNHYINCNVAQMDRGRVWAKVPFNEAYVRDGTPVTVYWEGYKRAAPGVVGDSVPSTDQKIEFIWRDGADIAFIGPAQDRLFGLHDETVVYGFGRCYYEIEVNGVRVRSAVKENRVSMGTPLGLCNIGG